MALTPSLFCVLVCLTWVLSVAGMSVCNYFNLTISSEVCVCNFVCMYICGDWSCAMRKQMHLSLDDVAWLCANTHHMFNRCACVSLCSHACLHTCVKPHVFT